MNILGKVSYCIFFTDTFLTVSAPCIFSPSGGRGDCVVVYIKRTGYCDFKGVVVHGEVADRFDVVIKNTSYIPD